jgi:hypothetical protein
VETKPTYLGTMITLATVAFGLLAAGAWNKCIADFVAVVMKPGTGIWGELIYAVLITLLAIFVVNGLAKMAGKGDAPKT